MSLAYILRRTGAKFGITEYDSNAEQKALLLDYINHAAQEIWESMDLPGSLKEIAVRVTANSEISLPPFVGELRAARSRNLKTRFNQRDMFPRYVTEPTDYEWAEWRHKGVSAIAVDITNASPLTFQIQSADNTIVTVTGKTATSHRISDSVTLSSTSVAGSASFEDIESISKNVYNNRDISVIDVNGVEIAVIYNDYLESRYLIVDVSEYPSGGELSDGTRAMEILYKQQLKRLINDSDTFGADGYDDIIVNKAFQLFLEDQDGKEEKAILTDAKVNRQLHLKVLSQEGATERRLKFEQNRYYDLISKSGIALRRRWIR